MRLHRSPFLAAALAAGLPSLPLAAFAAELPPIRIDDPSGQTRRVLDPGTSVVNASNSTDSAISVVYGNALVGDKISVFSSVHGSGISVTGNGYIGLTNSSVNAQSGSAISSLGSGAIIDVSNTNISTGSGSGVHASSQARVNLDGGSITVSSGNSGGAVRVSFGALVTAKNLTIETSWGPIINAEIGGSRVELTNVTMTNFYTGTGTTFEEGTGIVIKDSSLAMMDSRVTSEFGKGLLLRGDTVADVQTSSVVVGEHGITVADGAKLNMLGGTVQAGRSAVSIAQSASTLWGPSSAVIQDATLISSGEGGVDIVGDGAAATLQNVSIISAGPASFGVSLRDNASLVAQNLDIDAEQHGIINLGGTANVQGGNIRMRAAGASALTATRAALAPSSPVGTIAATGTRIVTEGANSIGVSATLPGAQISLTDVAIDTLGTASTGLVAADEANLAVVDSQIRTHGSASTGLSLQGSIGYGSVASTLHNTQLIVAGPGSNGVESRRQSEGANTVVLTGGSQIQTEDGAAFLVKGANHNFVIDNSLVLARSAADDSHGVLLNTQVMPAASDGSAPAVETASVTLEATHSLLTGDVLANSGQVDIALKSNSVLTGAVISGTGRVDSLSTDQTSVWHVRTNSNLGTLKNAGLVSFVAPNAQAGFKTLTVSDYVGGGTLAINTLLGDDTSPTDKLVIDGGTTSGVTGIHVVNAGGQGAKTTQGIRVVQAINGGTTTVDAFHLDAASMGYRGSADSLAVNGYEYFLVKGGEDGVATDWYLTSGYIPDEGETTPPGSGVEPLPPPGGGETPVPPVPPAETVANVSPEVGAYVGNRLAATNMFGHRLADRGVDQTKADQTGATGSGGRFWIRTQGTRRTGMQMAEGAVDIDADTGFLQMGGDLVRSRTGQNGLILAGVMGGYGESRIDSVSRLSRPDTGRTVSVDARGKVTGYSVGVYTTFYADDVTRLGAYADSWLQYGRYSNEISSEVGSARYHANVWTASLEAGYAIQPFAADSELGAIVVVPQAQVAYNYYDAKDATLPSMTLSNASPNSVSTRVGVRLYPLGTTDAAAPVRPFLEANWLHNSGTPQTNSGSATFNARPLRNAAELKVGVTGKVRDELHITGELFGLTGNDNQRGYGGMLNVGYRW